MSDKLLPCPFCGKEARMHLRYFSDCLEPYYLPGCDDHVMDYCADTEAEAVKMWNARTDYKDKSNESELNNYPMVEMTIELPVRVYYSRYGATRGSRSSIGVPEEPDENEGVEIQAVTLSNGNEVDISEHGIASIEELIMEEIEHE
jgi:hypothetical protein